MEPGSPWGVSEKLSESCKGNFAGAGSGSMGMRLDELANSSFLQEGKLEGDLRRRGKRGGQIKFQVSFTSGKTLATRRARGNLFWVKLKRSLQEIAIGINRPPSKGILDTRLPFPLPNPFTPLFFSIWPYNTNRKYMRQIYRIYLQCV
jgi:hypothetical protein